MEDLEDDAFEKKMNEFINDLDILLYKHKQNLEVLAKCYHIDKEFVVELSAERLIYTNFLVKHRE